VTHIEKVASLWLKILMDAVRMQVQILSILNFNLGQRVRLGLTYSQRPR